MLRSKDKQSGFTIVELLIVIVIIGILAAITIVAYGGIQQRARDAQRQSDLAHMAEAMLMYNQDTSDWVSVGGGDATGNGWFNGGSPTVLKTLQDAGYLLGSNISDPKCGASGFVSGSCSGYLKATCSGSGSTRVYFYAHLESKPAASLPTEMADCPAAAKGWWSTYQSNYYVRAG